MGSRPDHLFGKIAVAEGFLSETQVQALVEAQALARKSGRAPSLGELARELGLMTEQQVRQTLLLQEFNEIHADAMRLGALAVSNGFATEEQVRRGLDEQRQDFEETRQIPRKVGDILIGHGVLTSQQLDALLKAQDRLMTQATVREAAAPNPVQRAPAVRPRPTRTSLGKFVLQKKLGVGGMGAVYQAVDQSLQRTVALKVMLPELRRDATSRKRFLSEARSAAKLKHPGIVTIYETGEVEGIPYISMDLIAGETLATVAQRGLEPRLAIDLVADIAEAVGFAHEHGVVHRDLKPGNILITACGKPVVMDFGLAKNLDPLQTTLTQAGSMVGTPAYMAPEQVVGENDQIGPHTDVYALGVILFELLSGKRPFDAQTPPLLFVKILNEPAPHLPIEVRGLPADLSQVIERCLQKSGDSRYPDAGTLAAALRNTLTGKPTARGAASSPPASAKKPHDTARRQTGDEPLPWWKPWRGPARSRMVLLSGLLLVVGLLVVLVMDKSETERQEQTRQDQIALAKSGLVASVLARWGGLALTLQKMEGVYHDSRLDLEGKREQCRALWVDLEEFISATPPDPTSQATMRALAGWARRLAGFPNEGLGWMRDAERLDPDLPYGPLMEALVAFSEYLSLWPLPVVTVGAGGIEYQASTDEDDEMRAVRQRMEDLFEKAARARVWGAGMAQEFRIAIDTLRALRTGRHDQLESGLTALLGTAAMQVFKRDLLLARARTRLVLMRTDEGIKDLEVVAETRPAQVEVHHFLGRLHLDAAVVLSTQGVDASERYRKAIVHFDRAVGLDPRYYYAHMGRGMARKQMGDMQGAIADYEATLAIKPNYAYALHDRGLARLALGETEAAIGDFDAALRSMSTYLDACLSRGMAHRAKGDLKAALADCERALALDPKSALALLHRGSTRQSLGDMDGALADFDAAFAANPRNADVLLARGSARVKRGDTAGAIDDYDRALEVNRRLVAAYVGRGLARKEGKDLDGAIADYGEALAIDPRNSNAWNNRGRAWYAKKDYGQAIADYGKAIDLNPAYAEAYGNRGQARKAKGDLEGAVEDFEKALEVADPAWPHRRTVEGWLAEVRAALTGEPTPPR